MSMRVRARASMFVRLMVLSSLLVAVPLIVSGLIISLIGRHTLLGAAEEHARISSNAVQSTSDSLQQIVQKSLTQTADQMMGAGRASLESAGKTQITASKKALDDNLAAVLISTEAALSTASERLETTAKSAVEEANADLQRLHGESMVDVRTDFVKAARTHFEPLASELEKNNREPFIEAAYKTAEQRASTVEYSTQRALTDVSGRLANLARSQAVIALTDSDPSVPILVRRFANPDTRRGDLRVLRVVLISTTGAEVFRFPEAEDPEDWSGRPELEMVQVQAKEQADVEFTLPLNVAAPKERPTIRLVRQVAQGLGDRSGALVVDVALDNLVDLALHGDVPAGSAFQVLYMPDKAANPVAPLKSSRTEPAPKVGEVVAASQKSAMGTVPADVLKGLDLNKRFVPSTSVPFRFTDAEGRTMLGVARRITPELVAIAARSEEDALRNLKGVQAKVQASLDKAANDVGNRAVQAVDSTLEKTQPRQRQIASTARSTIKNEIDRMRRTVPKSLNENKDRVVAAAAQRIREETQKSTQQATQQIENTRNQELARAKGEIEQSAKREATTSASAMHGRAHGAANRAAGRMLLQTAWLVPMFLLCALVLAALTARSMVRPINQLVKSTQALAAGDYSQRIAIRGDDELVRLGLAYNEMAAAIQAGQSELQQSHDSLSAEKQRIQAIVESSPDGLVMLEGEGEVAFINAAAMRMLSIQSETPSHLPVRLAALSEQIAAKLAECIALAAPDGQVREVEFTDPARRVLQLRCVNLTTERGRSLGQLLHLHDITRERQIDEMKSDFISLVSHELRTPLTSILGFSSYLLTGKLGEVSPTQRTALESVNRQAKRLSAIIADFLDVSRIESGKIEMRKEPVPIANIASRVIEDLKPQATERNIQVSTHLAAESKPFVALGDEQRIAQVFTNLVGNAMKFTDADGSVNVWLSRQNGHITCQVQDTGCGIPADELPRVFDRFYQVEKVVTRKSGGTGLGLAIVKNIVEAHGGKIWIESEVGRGTSVFFNLPAAD